MSTISTILRIRCWQLFRQLKEIGLILLILVSPIAFVGLMGVLDVVAKDPIPKAGIGIVLLLLSFHWQRGDAEFLGKLSVSNPLIYAVEYTAAMLPISILFTTVAHDWTNALCIQLGAFLVALLPPLRFHKRSHWRSPLLRWFPLQAFEWRCGLRQYWWLLAIVYLLGLLLAHFVASVILCMLLLAYVAANQFNHLEGKEILEQSYFKQAFLRRKVLLQCRVFHLLMLPQYALFLFWHPSLWYLLLTAVVVTSLLFCIGVYYKYANYRPGRLMVNHQLILAISGVALFSPLMPVFLPGLLIYVFVLWRRAQKNLDYYYADH
ncbi:MAG: hypothetical protein AAFV95_13255 [Bacteroidota bacterium]